MSLLKLPEHIREQVRTGKLSTNEALRRGRKAEHQARTAAAAQAVAVQPPCMPAGRFPTIVIDPPWPYENVATRGTAEDHYPTMTLEELAKLCIPAADDAHVYLWATNAFLLASGELLKVWGFNYKVCITWVKPQMGLGNYFRSVTEHVLFATKGDLPTLRDDATNCFSAPREQHSKKPDVFYRLVESSPGPYLEMFARCRREGWSVWGNEL